MNGSAKSEERVQSGISWLLVGYAGLVAGAIYFLCIG
jgi:hypothetical protein